MNTPIVDMLNKYAESGALRLHMPGHKGKGLNIGAKADITELSFSDNLQDPSSVIAESQNLFAEEWKADKAIYLVNGSSVGVAAMIANARGSVLLQRSSHVSAYNAVKLFGKKAYVINDYDESLLPNDLTAEDLAQATESCPDVKTWFLTNPSYYGKILDLKKIREKALEMGIAVFVDSAHGAHFGLSEKLPEAAHKYADAAVISVHKTLPAFTQTAVLLTNNRELSKKLKSTVNALTTTSPSYLLLAGIDYARAYAFERKDKYDRLYADVRKFYSELPDGIKEVKTDDFTRVVLDVSGKNMSGYEAEKILAEKNVFAEFADRNRIVAILTLCDGKRELRRFLRALRSLGSGGGSISETAPPMFDKVVPLCFNDKVKKIKLEDCEGEISAANVGITPPCCPIIVAGEVISRSQIDFVSGKQIFGLDDGYITVKDG